GLSVPEICLNGGIYDGIKCICNEDLFYGPKCEFLMDVIPVPELHCSYEYLFPSLLVNVTITVEAQVKVTNREYNKSLEDLSSHYSLEIQAQFKKQMEVVYGAVPGYHGVEILGMRKGSIIVDHKIIFKVPIENNQTTIQQQMANITEEVRHSLTEIQSDEHCVRDTGMV
ncbi:hypothetical protein E2320_002555, partial [Naja naja]